MQDIELLVIVTGVIVGLAAIVARRARAGRPLGWALALLLGATMGLVGVLVMATLRSDVVPDEVEPVATPVLMVAVTLVLAVGTWLRWARR